jgi:hypothetical protein
VLNQYTAEPQNHDWQDIGLIYATSDIQRLAFFTQS